MKKAGSEGWPFSVGGLVFCKREKKLGERGTRVGPHEKEGEKAESFLAIFETAKVKGGQVGI